jgi:Rhodopirellula transposase DDE domain
MTLDPSGPYGGPSGEAAPFLFLMPTWWLGLVKAITPPVGAPRAAAMHAARSKAAHGKTPASLLRTFAFGFATSGTFERPGNGNFGKAELLGLHLGGSQSTVGPAEVPLGENAPTLARGDGDHRRSTAGVCAHWSSPLQSGDVFAALTFLGAGPEALGEARLTGVDPFDRMVEAVVEASISNGWSQKRCVADGEAPRVKMLGDGVRVEPPALTAALAAIGLGDDGFAAKWVRCAAVVDDAARVFRDRSDPGFRTIVELIAGTTTDTGLEVRAELDENKYATKVKISKEELAAVNLSRHSFHGDWNYTVSPNRRKN